MHNYDSLIAILLSFTGGIVRAICKENGNKDFKTYLAEGIVGTFTGVVTWLLLVDSLNGAFLGGLCGLAGWSGAPMLEFLSKLVRGKIKLKID